MRVSLTPGETSFDDAFLGRLSIPHDTDSFVVKRRDGLYAYHLAVVVDDAFQGVSHVVRGRDLLDSTPCHLRLQELLQLPHPSYAHLPLLVNDAGQKLSKQNLARALDDERPVANLLRCLQALGQSLPIDVAAGADAVLEHAVAAWDSARVPRQDVSVASLGA